MKLSKKKLSTYKKSLTEDVVKLIDTFQEESTLFFQNNIQVCKVLLQFPEA